MSETAQFIASHALILLGIGILFLGIGVWTVVAVTRAATRHKDLLWKWGDILVPGRLWRPSAYLMGHLALGLLLIVATVGFAVVAENVLAGRQLAAFDVAFAEALQAETSPPWRDGFWYVTWLGSGPVITAIAGAVVWVLVKRGHTLLAIMWSISQGGSALLNYAMKVGFARLRPEGADPMLYSSGWSFPSGHAMGTLVLCGVGAYVLARLFPSWIRHRVLIVLLLVWPLVIGFSRLYLGVHYISDVVAGFLAGTAWVAVCVSGTEVALRRREGVRITA
jgi:membrane-associated phospholipid phosphatase